MEVITIESKAFKQIMIKINMIAKFVCSYQDDGQSEDTMWVDSHDVSVFLSVSQRTLQRLRSSGDISYTNIRGRNYYTIADIRKMLEEKKIKSTDERLNDLIAKSKANAEKRRNPPKDR